MTATAATTIKRRPIRGFLYGIVLGLGLTLIVVGQGIAALGTWPPFLVLIAGIVIGTLWSTIGPAKAPKGPPPVEPEVIVDEAPAPAPVADGPEHAEPVMSEDADGDATEESSTEGP